MSVSAGGWWGPAHRCNAVDSRRWYPAAIIRVPRNPGRVRTPDCHHGLRRTPATRKDSADRNRTVPAPLAPLLVRGVTGAWAGRSWRSLSGLVAGIQGCLDALPRCDVERQAVGTVLLQPKIESTSKQLIFAHPRARELFICRVSFNREFASRGESSLPRSACQSLLRILSCSPGDDFVRPHHLVGPCSNV